jgi:hypothetical protein
MTDNPTPRPRSEEQLVEFLHSIDEPAPQRLHARVEAMVAEHAERPMTLREGLAGARLRLGALAAGGAAVGAAVALALGGAGGAALSVGQAAAVTLRPATLPAPSESHSDEAQLNAAVDGVSFPYWEDHFGWRSSGSREDTVAGRRVRTVFYTNGKGQQVGYAIVSGTPAPKMPAGETRWREGTAYHLTTSGGANVVTWHRDGHLCVVAARGVSPEKLLTLASWDDVAT